MKCNIKNIVSTAVLTMLSIAVLPARAESEKMIADSVNVTFMYGVPAVDVKKVSFGTVHRGESVRTGVCLHNQSKYDLEIKDIVYSNPDMKFGPTLDHIPPGTKIGFSGRIKVDGKPGKVRYTVKIYYKGVKKPTIAIFEGNIIK